MLIPGVDPQIEGEIPEIHALRVVGEMISFLEDIVRHPRASADGGAQEADRGQPPVAAQIHRQGASDPLARDHRLRHVHGQACKFGMTVSLWHKDEGSGATVWQYFATADGPGTERRTFGPLWRISQHALVRLVQRSGVTDAELLLKAMREAGQADRRRDGVGAAHAGGQAGAVDPVPERQRGADVADQFRRRRGQDGAGARYGVPARRPPLSLGTLTLIRVKAHSRRAKDFCAHDLLLASGA